MSRRSLGLALLLVLGLGASDPPSADGRRAFDDLLRFVRLGPRVSGSEGAYRAQLFIRSALVQAGWTASPKEPVPQGDPAPANIVAHKPGKRGDHILVVTHFDSPATPGGPLVGVNEGGSGVAALLETARALVSTPLESDLWLIFCDQHEAPPGSASLEPRLGGSREAARALASSGVLHTTRALLVVDMIADRDLSITPGGLRDEKLVTLLVSEAQRTDVRVDTKSLYRIQSDYLPFTDFGVRAILPFVDYEYGGTPAPGPFFHTALDDLNAVSSESFTKSVDLLIRVIRRIDRESLN